MKPDFDVYGEQGGRSSVFLLTPLTQAAVDWVAEHLPSDAQRLGTAVAVEHRYIQSIVDGIRADGLIVK